MLPEPSSHTAPWMLMCLDRRFSQSDPVSGYTFPTSPPSLLLPFRHYCWGPFGQHMGISDRRPRDETPQRSTDSPIGHPGTSRKQVVMDKSVISGFLHLLLD